MIRINPDDPGGIVWLASYPKSGNTWLRMVLYHTARIMLGIPLEGNDLHQIDRSSIYEARALSLFEEFLGKPVATASWQEIVPVRQRVHAEIAKRAPRPIHIKTHMAAVNIGDTPTINMSVSCGAIYIIRNPLDIVLSLADHLGSTIDDTITIMCHPSYHTSSSHDTVYEPWGSWSENVNSWTGFKTEIVLVQRYEDYLTDPINSFRAASDHLRMNPTPEQLAEAVELCDFKRLGAIEKESDYRERSPHAERFFRVGRADQWRDKLSDKQIRRIVEAHYRPMKEFGYLSEELYKYLPDGVDPNAPERLSDLL